MDTKLVSGPTNVVRLCGKIGKITKVIYIFSDRHVALENQTSCKHAFSEDFTDFIVQNLKRHTQTIDFFIEASPSNTLKKISTSATEIYIKKFVRFMYDALKNKDKNVVRKDNRIHFTDIRHIIGNDVSIGIVELKHRNDKLLEMIIERIKEHIELFSGISDGKHTKTSEMINKLMMQYNHTYIKKILNDIISQTLIPNLRKLLSCLIEFRGIDIPKKDIESAYLMSVKYYAIVMDVMLLRRFLDKDRVKTGVAYIGNAHMWFCIKILLVKFNFEITHIAKNPYNSIEELIETLNESENSFEKLLWINKINDQCIDVSHFPPDFL